MTIGALINFLATYCTISASLFIPSDAYVRVYNIISEHYSKLFLSILEKMNQVGTEATKTNHQVENIDLERTRDRLDLYIKRGTTHTYINLVFNILYHSFFVVSWTYRLLLYLYCTYRKSGLCGNIVYSENL